MTTENQNTEFTTEDLFVAESQDDLLNEFLADLEEAVDPLNEEDQDWLDDMYMALDAE